MRLGYRQYSNQIGVRFHDVFVTDSVLISSLETPIARRTSEQE